MSFGERLRELRKQAGFSQRGLAGRVDIDFSYVSKMENGVVLSPREIVIRKIVHELAVKLNRPDETELAYELITLSGKIPSDLARSVAHSSSALAGFKKLWANVRSVSSPPINIATPNQRHYRNRQPACRATPTALFLDSKVGNEGFRLHDLKDLNMSLSSEDATRIGLFKSSPIFSHLDTEHLVELSRLARARRLRANQSLFLEGDAVQCCYLVVSGTVKITKHSPSGTDIVIAVYGPGEIIGIIRLLVGKPHYSSAQAVTDTEVLGIEGNGFISFLHQYPEAAFRILERMLDVAAKRHETAAVRLSELVTERADYRLGRVLFQLYLKLGTSIHLGRRDIAELAGTTTETASRFVSRLKQMGVVEPFRGRVVVLEKDRLRQIADTQVPR